MKVGIDIRDLKTATTGQKTYLEEICRALQLQAPEEIEICLIDTRFPIIKGKLKLFKVLEQLNLHFWKQFSLPLKAALKGCDYILCTDYFVPYIHLGFKTAVVFHDAFFYENKEHYHPIFIWLFKNIALPSAKRSSFIFTPSNYAKQKIIQHYNTLPIRKIVIVNEGPKTLIIKDTNTEEYDIYRNYGIRKDIPFLLHVGVMNKRKNIPFLLRAFAKLLKQGYHYQLVLAGSLKTSQYISDELTILETIEKYKLKDHIILTGYISNEALSEVYKYASMYVFPSINEGFGLPILEAFRFNLPVLVANNTSLPEIGGDAVICFDPFNEDDLVNKIQFVIDHPEEKERLKEKGRLRLLEFSWEKAAKQIIELLS